MKRKVLEYMREKGWTELLHAYMRHTGAIYLGTEDSNKYIFLQDIEVSNGVSASLYIR